MGKILSLREAINLIWETVEIGREMESGCPYLFIVGAGISAPEILTANGICKFRPTGVNISFETV